MTESLLRNSLKEAHDKGEGGLLIWSNWTFWREFAFDINPGTEYYDFALSQIQNEKEATINFFCNNVKMPGFVAVPVEKLLSSNDDFKRILLFCNQNHYSGPISLVPSNVLCQTFE